MASVMVFEGEYDLACKDRLRAELARLADDFHVILDFTGVRYLDSTFLSELVRMSRLRRERGFPIETIVLSHSAIVRKLFALTQLDRLFHITDSLDGALEDAGEDATFQESFAADGMTVVS